MNERDRNSIDGAEPFYSVEQVAQAFNVSRWTIARLFADVPGVVDLSSTKRYGRRANRTLRIPRSAVQRLLHARRVK
jgi:AraC-like DNA-binding protein